MGSLIAIAKECISNSTPLRNSIWFDDGCRKLIRSRKAALRKFNLEPTTANLINYKINRVK